MNFQIDDAWHSVVVTVPDALCFISSDIDFCDSHNVYFVPISYQAFKYGWVLITQKLVHFRKFVKEAGGDADMKLSSHGIAVTALTEELWKAVLMNLEELLDHPQLDIQKCVKMYCRRSYSFWLNLEIFAFSALWFLKMISVDVSEKPV